VTDSPTLRHSFIRKPFFSPWFSAISLNLALRVQPWPLFLRDSRAAEAVAFLLSGYKRVSPLKGLRMYKSYLEAISLIERTHRRFLELVKLELEEVGIHDINNVQGLLLFNIGDAEMTVGELMWRGCYLGSNVSYNLKKMAETGYLVQERSEHDRRSVMVRLTEKGTKLRDRLQSIHVRRHAELLERTEITDEDLRAATVTLDRLERFWTRVPDIQAIAV